MVPDPNPNCEQYYDNQKSCEGNVTSYKCSLELC